jgi:very-short-patch-repair endonuclease
MTTYRYRHNSLALQAAAREMRREPTPAEARLWSALRGNALGVRFRRQHPVGQFILDFWCPAAHLVVEVDGEVHDTQRERDADRDLLLSYHGYHTVRFRNEEVLNDLEYVLEQLRAEVASRVRCTPSPGGSGEGAGG